jgi:hypothetical protein
MNDQLPDFEPEATSEPLAQPPKKRRKPMRRKAHVVTDAPKRRKMLRVVKANGIRRGRPKGSVSKPKLPPPVVLSLETEFTVGQLRDIWAVHGLLKKYDTPTRHKLLDELR